MKTITIMLDLETVQFLEQVAKTSGQSRDAVINVILAIELNRLKGTNGRSKKATSKESNGRTSKKQRLAKRK